MSKLVGTWDIESSENWDEYLKEIGVGFVMRKTAAGLKPTNVITNNGNQWTIKSVSTLKTTELNFTEGVEFDETTADGRNVKSTVRLEGADKLVQEQKDPKTGELKSTIVREIVNDKLVATLKAGSVVCTRVYKRTA